MACLDEPCRAVLKDGSLWTAVTSQFIDVLQIKLELMHTDQSFFAYFAQGGGKFLLPVNNYCPGLCSLPASRYKHLRWLIGKASKFEILEHRSALRYCLALALSAR